MSPCLTPAFSSFFKIEDKKEQWNALWKSGAIVFGLLAVLFIFKGTFDFAGGNDGYYAQNYGPEFMSALRNDRMSLFTKDILRSMGFVFAAFAILFLNNKGSLKEVISVVLIGLLFCMDLVPIDKNYVNKEDFVFAREMDEPFQPTEADLKILQDTTHFRVFEVNGQMSNARSSYFHKSIGGYHAAKPRRMQQLFDYQIAKNNVGVLNMLNVKYIIQNGEDGKPVALINPAANGNAWFVEKINWVNSADEEMKVLSSLDTKNIAVMNVKTNEYKGNIEKDSTASILLKTYRPNYLKYTSNNSKNGFGVFSEMYYQNGWKATIDGKEAQIYNVNYVLRGLSIPAGKHTIEFKFEPQVVQTGSRIALTSSILIFLLLLGGVYFETKKK